MSHYLERAAELINQALDSDLKSARNVPSLQANAKKDAAERFTQLAQIERGHDLEALRALVNGLQQGDAETAVEAG